MLPLILSGLLCTPAHAAGVPTNAEQYLPILQQEIALQWNTLQQPAVLAGQVEQETCPSLTNSQCWNPHAELKTSREYGFGLGQITKTASFNIFTSLPELDPAFKTWQWSNRYDPTLQLRALVDMDHQDFGYFSAAASATDQLAFMLAAYNGGPGSVMLDIKYCLALPDCVHTKWFGNVETHSRKSATSLGAEYGGQSAYNINRTYVSNILNLRMQKYEIYLDQSEP